MAAASFIIMACARGPSVVEQGIVSVGVYNVTEDKTLRVNVQPFAAQENNRPQPKELTENALPPLDAIKQVHAFLGERENTSYTVLGDITGLHYYMSMAELPSLFHRKNTASVTVVTDDKRYWDTSKGTMMPEQECKAYSLAQRV